MTNKKLLKKVEGKRYDRKPRYTRKGRKMSKERQASLAQQIMHA